MRKNFEFIESVASITEQQEQIQRIVDAVRIPEVTALWENSAMMNAFVENSKVLQKTIDTDSIVHALHDSSMVQALGKEIKSIMPTYQFESPAFKAIEPWNNSAVVNLAAGLSALIQNPVIQEIQAIRTDLSEWLNTIDFSPLTSILENIRDIGFEYDYEEIRKQFLKTMFDARWFPYAGWIADFKIVDAMLKILDTSRASKNRINRINKLIFSYYDKKEINNIKREWRQMSIPSYMTRILVQSVQAYHRREFALTVSALSTLWEGIIQEKTNDTSYRISRKTRDNLIKLIEENEFDKIFSSFCEEFIFYNCTKPEDVKLDVPGRHGIAHCWYNAYPSRKMALNAILFTDFLLRLKPLEKTEEEING